MGQKLLSRVQIKLPYACVYTDTDVYTKTDTDTKSYTDTEHRANTGWLTGTEWFIIAKTELS